MLYEIMRANVIPTILT